MKNTTRKLGRAAAFAALLLGALVAHGGFFRADLVADARRNAVVSR